jgi:phenylacetate-coenzyme A ligase PaaK-like adenylate-forming protein
VPHLVSYASHLVRLSEAARRAGIDLSGARFMTIGEPLTPARATSIRHCGADVTAAYGTMEAGFIALGCAAPDTSDDAHLLHDLVSVVATQRPDEVPGLPGGALFVSSLRPSAPLVLFNVSVGDRATLTSRQCGCPLAHAGWPGHVHTIRSFEKLTAGGMSFLDADLIRVLEDVLPARFGGASTDYQLVEEEADDGVPMVRLLVHPQVGPLDEQAVAKAFLEAIGGGSGSDRVMSILWRSAGLLRVERRPPMMTGSGKILHLHVERQAASGPSV